MKIDKDSLINLLSGLMPAPKKHIKDLLLNVKFEIKNNKLTLSTTDMNYYSSSSIDFNEDECSFLIEYNKFNNAIKSFLEGDIELSLKKEKLVLKQKKIKFQFTVKNALDFPVEPDLSCFEKSFSLSDENINEIVKKVVFFNAFESNNIQELVDIRAINDKIYFASTTGTIASRYSIEHDGLSEFQYAFSGDSLINSLKLFKKNNCESVDFVFSENNLLLKCDNYRVYIRKSTFKYPDITRIIPKEKLNSSVVDKDILKISLDRCSIVNNDNSNKIKLSFNENKLKIYTKDISGDYNDEIKCNSTGEFEFIVDFTMLYRFIKIIESDDIVFNFHGERKAITVDSSCFNNYECLFTPIMYM